MRARCSPTPLTVELDAVAPATVAVIAASLPGELVDGAISGPVAETGRRGGDPRRPGVRWVVLDGPVGAASAAKACTASVRKGHQALLAHALVTAQAHGVLDTVLADLRLDFPDAAVAPAATAAAKAWRFVDEMTRSPRPRRTPA